MSRFVAGRAAGCGSSSTSNSSGGNSSSSSASASPASGTTQVAYAASLAFLNEKIVGPAFAAATGLKYSGTAGPSDGLESEIASKEITPDAFEAVGGDNITPLFPKFTTWYVQYATTSIVLAYNPKSKYASQLEAIGNGTKPIKDLFPLLETSGSSSAGLHYITLPSAINLGDAADPAAYHKASITITGNVTKHGSPLTIDITTINNSANGNKFVAYVLSPAGLALHQQGGYTLLKPTLTGSGAPASVTSELGS